MKKKILLLAIALTAALGTQLSAAPQSGCFMFCPCPEDPNFCVLCCPGPDSTCPRLLCE